MKKFFKLFAVALVAGCMFTACGEKENNGENNGGDNGGNTPTGQNGKVVVNFGGNEWTAQGGGALQDASYGITGVSAWSDPQGAAYPAADVYVYGTTNGTLTDTFDEINGWNDDKMSYVEYYKDGSVTDGTYNYGDHWAASATVVLSEMDATALTLSMTCNAEMFKALDVLSSGAPYSTVAECPKTSMAVVAQNIAFEVQ